MKSVEQAGLLGSVRCGWKHPHRFFGYIRQGKILLIAVPAVLASLFAWGLRVPSGQTTLNQGSPLERLPHDQVGSDESRSTTTNDYSEVNALAVVSLTAVISSASADSNQPRLTSVNSARETALTDQNRRGQEASNTPLSEEIPNFHIPLVFLDHANVLPQTEEVAAAVQKVQQDFVDSTGAATANPADPGYADRWTQFQPTADERFYALFGIEAFNAMWIARVRDSGHF